MISDRLRVLITGSNGQLGHCLITSSPIQDVDLLPYDRGTLDITDRGAVESTLVSSNPGMVINCAAYTAVDRAESEREQAFSVNVEGARNLAEACRSLDIPMVHFSTDYVYDSRGHTPLTEDHPCKPTSVYGQSKLEGEQQVRKANPKSVVIRTSWLYSEFGHNFVKTMLRLANTNKVLSVVDDQTGSPTYAMDLADATWAVVRAVSTEQSGYGIYNYSNTGSASWNEFAREIFRIRQLEVDVRGISTEAFGAPAPRPAYSVLSTGRIRQQFDLQIRDWQSALRDCLSKIQLTT